MKQKFTSYGLGIYKSKTAERCNLMETKKFKDSHRVNAAIRSVLVRLNPALYLVKFPVAVSRETSAPTERAPLPNTPERLTMGLAVNPMLALTPA